MKSYWTDNRLRIVGKAWEVRRYLQLMVQNGGADTKLADYLGGGRSPLTQPLRRSGSAARIITFPGNRG